MSGDHRLEMEAYWRGYQDSHKSVQFNGLTPAEHERLTILFEEMAEATQVVGKILRHGYPSYNPIVPNSPINRSLLEFELGHVLYAIGMLVDAKDLLAHNINDSQKEKSVSIQKYLHHQGASPAMPNGGRMHSWETRDGYGGTYNVCERCGLSEDFVKAFLKGSDSLCKWTA